MGQRATAALALTALAAVLASCGGGGQSEADPRGDTAQILAMINAMERSDPRNCVRFQTLSFTEQMTKRRGDAAIRSCEEEERSGDEESWKGSLQIRVQGTSARLRAVQNGGRFDGQEAEFALVKRAGRWKVDEVVRFVKMRRASIVAEIAADGIRSASSRSELDHVECVIERMERFDVPALEHLILSPDARPFEELLESCRQRERPSQAL